MTKKKFKMDIWFAITIGLLLLYLVFLIFPMGNLFRMAFYDGENFTLKYFQTFFTKKYYTMTIANSFKVSTAATIVSMRRLTLLAVLAGMPRVLAASLTDIPSNETSRQSSLLDAARADCVRTLSSAAARQAMRHLISSAKAGSGDAALRMSATSSNCCWTARCAASRRKRSITMRRAIVARYVRKRARDGS